MKYSIELVKNIPEYIDENGCVKTHTVRVYRKDTCVSTNHFEEMLTASSYAAGVRRGLEIVLGHNAEIEIKYINLYTVYDPSNNG